MKKYLLAAFFFCSVQSLIAQSATDSLTIYLLGSSINVNHYLRLITVDSKQLIQQTASRQDGVFKLSSITSRDFKVAVFKDSLLIKMKLVERSKQQQVVLIALSEDTSVNLETVMIKTAHSPVELRADRLVYHMRMSAFNQGFNALEVLAEVPFVRVNNHGLTIIGKGGVTLMVDNKKLRFSNTQLLAYLKAMPSERIQKIEVITNPPVKYDSYGNGGIINIQLKKARKEGYALLLSSDYIQRVKPSFANSLNFNYHHEKWNFNINLGSLVQEVNSKSYFEFRNPKAGLIRKSLRQKQRDNNQFFSTLTVDYQLNDQVNLGAIYTYSYQDNQAVSGQKTTIANLESLNDVLSSSAIRQKHIVNLYADVKIDTLGTTLNLLGTVIGNEEDNHSDLRSQYFKNSRRQRNTAYEFKATLNKSITDSMRVDFGFKTYYLSNAIFNYNRAEQQSHWFNYRELTYTFFADFYVDITDDFSLVAGVKYEGWKRKINAVKLPDHYLFPTLNLAYHPNPHNSFSFSYAKRLVKPYMEDLDPYKVYVDPYTYRVGNPYLKPFVIHNFEVKFIHQHRFIVTLYTQLYDDLYGTVMKLQGDTQVKTVENYQDARQYGGTASYFFKNLEWFNARAMIHAFYSDNYNFDDDFCVFDGWTTAFYVNGNFYLDAEKNTVLTASYFYTLPTKVGNSKTRNFATFNLNFKLPIIEDVLDLTLSATDIFRQQNRRGKVFYATNNMQLYQHYRDTRRFKIGVTLKLGKKKPIRKIHHKSRIHK